MTMTLGSPAHERIVAIRRDLHQHPELSWQEERTSRVIADRLGELGIAFRKAVAGTGIIADIPGQTSTCIALRADMDALPLQEETGLSFASTNEGIMHACGHDGHVSILLGAAELLALEEDLPVSIRLIFQPAEELGAGAKRMIEEGALEGVDMIFGGHLDRGYDPGELIVTEGCVNASTDEFYITLSGTGGHGARPHETVDPLVVGSFLVSEFQTIITRTLDPTHAAVLSVGQFHAGTAPNIIANVATMDGTLRAQHPVAQTKLQDGVRRLAEGIAAAHGVDVKVEIVEGTPPVINEGVPLTIARFAAEDVVGAARVRPMSSGNMGGEDFGFYVEQVPGCFIRYGARPPGESYPAHSSRFWWDEAALAHGANWMRAVAIAAGQHLDT